VSDAIAAILALNEASAIGMEYESDEQMNATVSTTRINAVNLFTLNPMAPASETHRASQLNFPLSLLGIHGDVGVQQWF